MACNFIKKLKTNKGDFSIPFIILILTALIFASSFYKTIRVDYALNEVQSIMDIAGINTLSTALDNQILKDEIFALDRDDYLDPNNKANQKFKDFDKDIRLFYKGMLNFNPEFVPSYEINYQKIYFEISDYENLGAEGNIPQIILETVITIELNVGKNAAQIISAENKINSYYSSRSKSRVNVEGMRLSDNGNILLTLHSTERATYK